MEALTERQEKVRKITKGIVKLMLCPIWIPIVIVQYLASNLNFFLEDVLLFEGGAAIDSFSEWIAKKFNKD